MYSPEKKLLNDENTYKKQLYLDPNIQKWKEIKYYDVEKISNIYNVTSWHEIIWMPVHVHYPSFIPITGIFIIRKPQDRFNWKMDITQ